MIYTVHQAKTQLSKLIAAALQGDEVIIARGETPVVKLQALAAAFLVGVLSARRR